MSKKTIRVILIKPAQEVPGTNGRVFLTPDRPTVHTITDTYQGLRDLVGGSFDHVTLGPIEPTAKRTGLDMWVHDEGLLIGLPFNPIASALTRGATIVGPAVITRYDEEGETHGVTQTDINNFGAKEAHES